MTTNAPTRSLGKTGVEVLPVSLGGEGILRTHGREREAVPMILAALEAGVRYCDTAPAYASSQDYYGMAFEQAGAEARARVCLASKTHERSRDGALALLDDSLRRLHTDHLDIWQLHDLRTMGDLDRIFARGGAIEAVETAKRDKRIRHVGITGHHDASILMEAMRRYDFDTVLCALNPADVRRAPFSSTVIPEARRRGMGVVGMKVLAGGRFPQDRSLAIEDLIRYAATQADTVIIGCSTIDEVKQNLAVVRDFEAMDEATRRALEVKIAPKADRYDYFKA